MNREKTWKGKRRAASAGLRVLPGGDDQPREAPHSLEAEEYLLSCCFIDGAETVARCVDEQLKPNAFYSPANRIIFEKLLELYARNVPIDTAIVAEDLKTGGQLDAIGGFAYLTQVSSRIPTTAQAPYFIEKVKEKWILRELLRESREAIERIEAYAGNNDEDLENLIAPVATRFNRAIDFIRSGRETMETRAEQGYQRTLRKLEGKQDTSRQLFTGMREFDQRFGPFDVFEDELLIGVAALPSVGKSALTRKWADHFLAAGKKGIVFPFETGIAKWLEMSAGTACRINVRNLTDLPTDMATRYRAALEERRRWIGERLWIFDDAMKAETLCARVEDHVRRFGPVDFVIVDHLHELYSTEKFRGQREPELGYIAKLLKKTAKRLNTPFFVPTQLNRSSAKDGALRRPMMQDIRGSGEIEAAYDRLLMIHVPKDDMRGAEQTDNQSRVMIEIIQAKSRNGPKGHRAFWFDRPFTDYVEIHDNEFERRPNIPGGAASAGGYKR